MLIIDIDFGENIVIMELQTPRGGLEKAWLVIGLHQWWTSLIAWLEWSDWLIVCSLPASCLADVAMTKLYHPDNLLTLTSLLSQFKELPVDRLVLWKRLAHKFVQMVNSDVGCVSYCLSSGWSSLGLGCATETWNVRPNLFKPEAETCIFPLKFSPVLLLFFFCKVEW
jgi:hypothetical protein